MNKSKLLFLGMVLGVMLPLLFVGCKKKEDGKLTVTTKPIAEIGANSAKSGGNVTATGNATVGTCGVCWSESPSPTTNDYFTTDIIGLGEYISVMNNLKASTKYYVRAYATLSSGVLMYGEEMDFTTLSDGGGNGGGNGGGDGTLSVLTNDATQITASSAVCGGNVTINGEVTVTVKGVCFGTSHTPTLENQHTSDGQGAGAFTANLTGLAASTVYYVRAYATSNLGVTTYGNEISFTTQADGGGGTQGDLPIVITNEITEITRNTAKGGGVVNSDGGSPVTARGLCWSTSSDPTLSNSTTFGGMGTGPFNVQMTDLEIGTTYYVKAYATNSVGTAYGNEVSFTTKGLPPQGAINGLFSVSETKQVYFSQGNLQYQASTNTWRFAEHQWDWVGAYVYVDGVQYLIEGTVSGSNNDNRSATYSGWIDLFGWGTSGRNHGAICYQPWSTGTKDDYYAYGSANNNLSDFTGEADWGYNAISNGGNQEGLWRTLSSSEWDYVLLHRVTSSGIRFAAAKVNNQRGYVVLPDDWSSSYYTLNNANNDNYVVDYTANTISESVWMNSFQSHGAIFLPNNMGYRDPNNVPASGFYWSSSNYDGSDAAMMVININIYHHYSKNAWIAVRLAHDY
ncbi:MAG: hypothetical protein MJZ97_05955 [Bacteroidales bacterium]|nr:hypothetical protein [Bacteroidales bacterium]